MSNNNVYPDFSKLVDVIGSLPGISNVSSNVDYFDKNESLRIFFYVSKTDNGLFFLTRCCDRRYWKFGNSWKIELSVGDQYDKILPVTYMLSSCDVKGINAYAQSIDLIENMNHHLNHDNFLIAYNLNRDTFKRNYISYMRKLKLENIKLK